jgi:hypothetical protein
MMVRNKANSAVAASTVAAMPLVIALVVLFPCPA